MMKIQMAKKDLKAALDVVSKSMASTGGDLSTCFLFRRNPKDPSKTEVLTYSGRVYSGSTITAAVTEGDDKFSIEGRRLDTFLAAIPDDVVTLSYDAGIVEASIPESHGFDPICFQSLDPSNFPYWDKLLDDAKLTATISAVRLKAALNYSHQFASDQESKKPEICVCEIKDGILRSTNNVAVTMLTVKGLENATLRVHVRDVGSLLKFLAGIDGPVEVLENERNMFFRNPADGTIYGEGRFLEKFPTFTRPDDGDQHSWTLNVEALKKGIQYLYSGAAWEDSRVRFNRPDPKGPVHMSMMLAPGKTRKVSLPVLHESATANATPVPDDGFVISHPTLNRVLDLLIGTTVQLGINARKKNGYIRIVENPFADEKGQNGDEYLTVVAWLK